MNGYTKSGPTRLDHRRATERLGSAPSATHQLIAQLGRDEDRSAAGVGVLVPAEGLSFKSALPTKQA
jgi:hypothetical protein